jgi:hypothetical protein
MKIKKDYEVKKKLKDAYRILEETQRDEWNNLYVLNAAEKGRASKIEPEP